MTSRRRAAWLHPTRLIILAYVAVAAVGSVLLLLPWATPGNGSVSVSEAVFTATSAVTVTGLTVVDTATEWSRFGQVVILVLIQVGGFGITTFASVFAVLVFRRLGLRARLATQLESNQPEVGDLRSLVRRIALFYGVAEALGIVVLTTVVVLRGDTSVLTALWQGVFHAVSAFNNAGFSVLVGNFESLEMAATFLLAVMALVVVGGIGFPVVAEVFRQHRSPRRWSIHTKLTLATTALLLVAGALAVGALEWGNPATLGSLGTLDRIVNAGFGSVTARTAGFNTFDYSLATPATQAVTMVLMFIGGGSASAAGGIKVTTFALLGFVIASELRGDKDVNTFSRRISESTQRQAVAVALLGVGTVVAGTLAIAASTPGPALSAVLFEAVSALGTVGLSTGLTSELGVPGQLVVSLLMLAGRLGPVTFGTALVLRRRQVLLRYPEGRPLIG